MSGNKMRKLISYWYGSSSGRYIQQLSSSGTQNKGYSGRLWQRWRFDFNSTFDLTYSRPRVKRVQLTNFRIACIKGEINSV